MKLNLPTHTFLKHYGFGMNPLLSGRFVGGQFNTSYILYGHVFYHDSVYKD